MEKIINIQEIHEEDSEYSWGGMSGYAITTDKQVIKMLIDNNQSCCEQWGYFMSEDNLDSFIGANINNIYLTDTALNTQEVTNVYEGGIMFVNVDTDRGTLQFVAYNEHNGYYGHQACVISKQLNHEEWL